MTASAVKDNRLALSVRSFLLRSDAFGGTALAALLIICVVLALLEPQFLTPSNLLNVGRQASVLIIVSCGMTIVILSGNIFYLYVFLEIAAIASFALIAYFRDEPGAEVVESLSFSSLSFELRGQIVMDLLVLGIDCQGLLVIIERLGESALT